MNIKATAFTVSNMFYYIHVNANLESAHMHAYSYNFYFTAHIIIILLVVHIDIDIEILFCVEYCTTCNISPVVFLLQQTRLNKHF